MDPNIPPKIYRANDYKALYCNQTQVGFSQFEIFAILSEASSDWDGAPILEQRGRISMAPEQALLLSNYLVNAVQRWEKLSNRKVEMPPGAVHEAYKDEG